MLPDLEEPPAGTSCPRCGEPLRLTGFCGACEEGVTPACRDCEGTGIAWVHVCRNEAECARRCPVEQPCMACLGLGEKTA
jgi:hypothetical protein